MTSHAKDAEAIFLAALDMAAADQRAAYVETACAGDAELLGRVRKLLACHDGTRGPLDAPPPGLAATIDVPLPSERPGTVIGPYKLLEQIGEGGMGTVFMAEQSQPVQRKVALKIIKVGMDSRQVIARFDAERQALALMDHPNIARVLEAGATDSGRPYFVMELVKGTAITRYCDEHHLTPRERVQLFVPVCQAVQHAHQKGIIHRDLKPSNVLIARYDGKPVPKVIDFGVAKATGQKLTERTLFTGFGALVGTLEYMSPEQAELNQLDIDTRSDIYSLGVLLYELLTGTTPLDRKRLQEGALLEMLRCIREEEPPTPSTRLSTSQALPALSTQRSTEPAKLAGLVRGELDWIVMKALEKDRNRRYDTANSMGQDIQRYLVDEPVLAGPPSTRYRLRKFLRRNRGAVTAASLVLAALLIGIVGTSWGWLHATRATEQVENARNDEREARKREQQEKLEVVRQRNKAAEYAVRWMLHRADDNIDEPSGLAWLARALEFVPDDQPELESFIRRALMIRYQTRHDVILSGFPFDNVLSVRPDGQQFLVQRNSPKKSVALWSVANKQVQPLQLPPKLDPSLHSGVFSPNGKFLLAVARGDWALYLWETETGRLVGEVPGALGAGSNAFSRDGAMLIFAPYSEVPNTPGPLNVVRVEPLERLSSIRAPGGVIAFELHPDGKTLWTFGGDQTVRCWQLATGEPSGDPWAFPKGSVVGFSSDGRRLLVAAPKREVRAYDLETRRPVGPAMSRTNEAVVELASSPDGSRGVVVSTDDAARPITESNKFLDCYELVSGRRSHTRFDGALSPVFGPDGKNVLIIGVSGNYGRLAALFDAVTGRRFASIDVSAEGAAVWMPDGKALWFGGYRDLTPFAGDAATARLWSEVFSYHELTTADEVRLLDEDAWLQRRQSLEEWARDRPLPDAVVAAIRDRSGWLRGRFTALYASGNASDEVMLPLWDRLLVLEPTEEGFSQRGHIRLRLNRYEEALADFAWVLKKDPANDEVYRSRSYAHIGLRQWPEAIRDLQEFRKQALAHAHSDPAIGRYLIGIHELSLLQLHTGDQSGYSANCEDARTLFARLKKTEDYQTDALLWYCSLNSGGLGDPSKLRPIFEKRKRLGADDLYYFQPGVATFLYRSGRFQEVLDDLGSKKIRNSSGDVTAQLLRTMALFKLGRNDEAKKALAATEADKAQQAQTNEWTWQAEFAWGLLRRELENLKP